MQKRLAKAIAKAEEETMRDFNEVKYVTQQTLSMDDRRFMAKVH